MNSQSSIYQALNDLLKQPDIDQINKIAKKQNTNIYLVGGTVRDAYLGQIKATKDYDFAVLGDISAIELAKQVADHLNGHFVLLDEKNDTARIILPSKNIIDFALCVGKSIDEDLLRRDFTMNALAYDLDQPNKIIDPTNGLSDIEARVIRCVSEKSFVEDPLRLIRAFRFMAALNFSIDSQTLAFITKHQKLLSNVAMERINYEIFAIAKTNSFGKTISKMASTGLLETIFPEFIDLHKVPPNAYHHLPLFDHSIETAHQIEIIENALPNWVVKNAKIPLSHEIDRRAALKIAALIHDIGKPSTWQITDEGKHTFIAHDKIGAVMAEKLAHRLKFPKIVERFITKLVRWHLRPGHLFHQGPPTDRAVNRFYRSMGHETPELIWLSLADFEATNGPDLQKDRSQTKEKLHELLAGFYVYIKEIEPKPQFLTGDDVMSILGIKAGPKIGEILTELIEAQDLQEVTNRQEAIEFVQKRYKQQH
jgi:putative nucleotidyltransferase with HDIG domain